jgi:transcriptional regulator with XRE-family HTH domain
MSKKVKPAKPLEQYEALRRIIEIKTNDGIPYEKMAPMIGVSVCTLSRWLHGSFSKANMGSCMLLANFLEKYDKAKKDGKLDEFFPFPCRK